MTGSTPDVAGVADVGTICPYCRFPLKSGVSTATCISCQARHHAECWDDNGGCAITACAAGPAGVATGKGAAAPVRGDGPRVVAAAAPVTAVTAPTTPADREARPPASGGAFGRRLVLVLAAVSTLSLAAVGYLLTRGSDSEDVTNALPAQGDSAQAGATGPTVTLQTQASAAPADATNPTVTVQTRPIPAGGGPSTASTTSPNGGRAAMVRLMRLYAVAFSNRDPEAMRRLFTPGVIRHGFQRGGCGDAVGRKSVIEAYQAQFALGTGRYTLRGVSANAIDMSGAHPRIDARYAIAGGNDGRVTVDFSNIRGRWLISRVNSHC